MKETEGCQTPTLIGQNPMMHQINEWKDARLVAVGRCWRGGGGGGRGTTTGKFQFVEGTMGMLKEVGYRRNNPGSGDGMEGTIEMKCL
jgi:hypothetical protein